MKIAFVEFTGKGGIHQYCVKYCEKLEEAGISSFLITSRIHEGLSTNISIYGMEPYEGLFGILLKVKKKFVKREKVGRLSKGINRNSERGVNVLWSKIFRLLKRKRPDVLHIQWLWDHYPCQYEHLKRIRDMGVKVFFTFHNSAPHEDINEYIKGFYSGLDEYVDLFFTHSEYDRNNIERLYGVSNDRIKVVPMPSVLELTPINKRPSNKLNLLFFGLIRHYKGLDTLIEFFDKNDLPNISLNIIGKIDEELKNDYLKLLKNSTKDNIFFSFDYVDSKEIPKIFSNADYLIMPYRSATQSALISLSYNLGTPVIATACGGLPEMIVNGETGFILDELSHLKTLIEEKDLKTMSEGMSKNCIKYYQNKLSWNKIIENMLELIG